MNLEVLRERSNQSVLLGLLVLVCEPRCVCMGSPCLGKRQGNLQKPDVNKVDTILGYRLSHLIAIVSPSAKAAGRFWGLRFRSGVDVSGGNGRALIIRDLGREIDLRRDRERQQRRKTDAAVGPSGIRARRINLVCSHDQPGKGKVIHVTWTPTCIAEIQRKAGQSLNLHAAFRLMVLIVIG